MPAVSEAQRRYLNAKFGHGWVVQHGFDNEGKLPEYVNRKRKKRPRHVEAFHQMLAAGGNHR